MKLLVATIGCMLFSFGAAISKRNAHLQEVEAEADPAAEPYDADKIFARFDHNNDGSISASEVAHVSRGTGEIGDNFEKFEFADADGDGHVTRAEAEAAVKIGNELEEEGSDE